MALHHHAQRFVASTEAFLQEDTMTEAWHHVEDAMASIDQGAVSLVAIALGAVLVARGFALMKPSFVLLSSVALGIRTATVACQQGQVLPGIVSSIVVCACGIVFAHRLYPIFVFAIGAAMAGALTFFFRKALELTNSPAALVGLMMLVSVLGGLLLQNLRLLSFRLLTPVLGGMLVAASLRFLLLELFTSATVTWLSFTHFSLNPAYVVTDPVEIFFVVSWGVCCCLGWYSQLFAAIAGVDPLALPEHLTHQLLRLNSWFPWVFDGGEEFAELIPSWRQEREPFLPKAEMDTVDGKVDYRPECLILAMVFNVLLLNFLMMSKPLLFLGHVVMMSAAFQVFMTASMSSYLTPSRVLLGLKGSPVLRHFTHGSLNMLVLFFAIGGYLSIYARHVDTHSSQLGHGGVMRIAHVWTGYVTLGLLFIMCFSGAVKMFAGLTSGSSDDVAKFHAHLGRSLYGFAAVNQLFAYFVPGLMPLWASLLLSAVLLCTVSATLYLLITREPWAVQYMKRFNDRMEREVSGELPVLMNRPPEIYGLIAKTGTLSSRSTRLESLKSLANSSHRSGGGCSRPSSRKSTVSDWEPLLGAMEVQEQKATLSQIFVNWHRHIQSTKISRAQAELQGSNNLVDFLSSALVVPKSER